MRYAIEHIECDHCNTELTEESVTNGELKLGAPFNVIKELELCGPCADNLSDVGSTKTPSSQEEDIWQCPICQRTFATKAGLNQHRTKKSHD